MANPKGLLVIPIGYNPSGDIRAFTVNVNDYLNTVLETGLTGGGMGEPSGPQAVVCGIDPDGNIRAVELDENDNLLISLLGGSANQIIKSDGTDAEWDDLTDVIEAAILTTNGDILIRNASGIVTRLAIGSNGQILGVSGSLPAWQNEVAPGMTMIEDIHLASAVAEIKFENIPTTYKHLRLVGSLRSAEAQTYDILLIRFNGDIGNNYNYMFFSIYHNNVLATGEGLGLTYFNPCAITGDNAISGRFAGFDMTIMDYADTVKHKDMITFRGYSRDNLTGGGQSINNARCTWRSLSAIDEILFYLSGNDNFVVGSRMTLYGMN